MLIFMTSGLCPEAYNAAKTALGIYSTLETHYTSVISQTLIGCFIGYFLNCIQ